MIFAQTVLKNSDSKSMPTDKNEEIEVSELLKGCQMPKVNYTNAKGSCFWMEGWRSTLCTCEECKLVRLNIKYY